MRRIPGFCSHLLRWSRLTFRRRIRTDHNLQCFTDPQAVRAAMSFDLPATTVEKASVDLPWHRLRLRQ